MKILCCYCQPQNDTLLEIIKVGLFPLIVAVLAYYFFDRYNVLKKRKNDSILGAIILKTLIEEVQNGIISMEITFNSCGKEKPRRLPRKSWVGINTIPDDVILRIYALSIKAENRGFPIEQIRSHTKNYFDHMTVNWDKYLKMYDDLKKNKKIPDFIKEYDNAAKGVIDMLNNACELLKANSKRIFPK